MVLAVAGIMTKKGILCKGEIERERERAEKIEKFWKKVLGFLENFCLTRVYARPARPILIFNSNRKFNARIARVG